MRAWWRYLLIVLALLLLVLAGVAWWLVQGFDSERVKRIASDWMRTHQDRELVFEGPVRLQLWPQPAVAVQKVRLSERGRPDQNFASIDSAALSLHLQPLLQRREIEVESVSARGVTLRFSMNQDGSLNGQPEIVQTPSHPLGVALANSARRALLQCGPYKMPPEKYATWRSVEATFNPKDVF